MKFEKSSSPVSPAAKDTAPIKDTKQIRLSAFYAFVASVAVALVFLLDPYGVDVEKAQKSLAIGWPIKLASALFFLASLIPVSRMLMSAKYQDLKVLLDEWAAFLIFAAMLPLLATRLFAEALAANMLPIFVGAASAFHQFFGIISLVMAVWAFICFFSPSIANGWFVGRRIFRWVVAAAPIAILFVISAVVLCQIIFGN